MTYVLIKREYSDEEILEEFSDREEALDTLKKTVFKQMEKYPSGFFLERLEHKDERIIGYFSFFTEDMFVCVLSFEVMELDIPSI
jgi:hypothetical protein